MRGDCEEERGGRGRATLRHGCAGDCAGRSGRTERTPAPRAERSIDGRGATTPRRTATEGSGGEGGRGGGGRGTGLRAGATTPTNRLRAQRTGKTTTPGETSARARGARPRWPSDANNERRRAWRAGARATIRLPLFRCVWSGREETHSARMIRKAERSEAVAGHLVLEAECRIPGDAVAWYARPSEARP